MRVPSGTGDADKTPPCGITYLRATAGEPYQLKASATWQITWEGSGDVTFDLQRQGGKVMLTVTHRRLPDRDTLLKVAAGWHMHLDILVARANGMPAAEFWSGWQRLHADYGRRIPA